MRHEDFVRISNAELPVGVIVYLAGDNEYRFSYSNGGTIKQQAERKEAIKQFIAKHNGVITSDERYYCIIAKFAG